MCSPPASSHRARFLHWLTSKTSRSLQPSTTASTPVPVTRTQPRTERLRSSSRWSEMQRSDVSETAEPQKARLRCVRFGRPRARTSVAVSERAQQNDWGSIRHGPDSLLDENKDLQDPTPSAPWQHWSSKQLRCRSNRCNQQGKAFAAEGRDTRSSAGNPRPL